MILQDGACRILVWISLALSACVHHHTTALAVDRVVAILAPFWHRNLNKAVTAKRISLTISVAAFILTSAEMPFREMDEKLKICVYNPSPPPLYFTIYMLSAISYVPIVLLLFSNCIFIWALKERPSKNPSSSNTEAANAREMQRRSNERNYTLMIIATTCAFIGFQFLSFGLFTESASRNKLGDGSAAFFRTLARLPIILNSSLNVAFYSSNPMFRKALKTSLKRK